MNAPAIAPPDGPFPAPADGGMFFESSSQLRILRHLEQAIAQDDRLTVLTGDEGVGKTTVAQRLLHGLDPGAVWWVLVSAAQLDAGDLPGSLARAFGDSTGAASSAAGLQADLHAHLTQHAAGRTVLAVIDDAHGLPPEAVAELDDLTREGPLRLLLVGRSALRMNLQSQLPLHPASLSCHLEPLTEGETPAYIEHRLRRVGWDGTPDFTDEARALIHRFSRGVPQRINRLCERLWSAAREHGERTIGVDAVRRIARPHGDAAAIPMLTSAVDEPLASGWFAASELPPESDPLPRWAGPASEPQAVAARQRRFGFGVLAAAGVVACAFAVWAWRAWQVSKPEVPMTAAQRPAAERPAPPAQAPTPSSQSPTPSAQAPAPPSAQAPATRAQAAVAPPAAKAPALPATPTAATSAEANPPRAQPTAIAERARPPAPPRATATAPTRPANRNGTPTAPPSPVPGPCTATVAALGLCTPTGNAP